MRSDRPRPLNQSERQVLDALLAEDFPGAAELRAQVPHVSVVGRCDCGCPTVDLEVPPEVPPSPVETRSRLAPVEGRVAPLGDEPVGEIILFVDGGRLTGLEYVFFQDRAPTEWPQRGRIAVTRTG